MRVSTNMLYSSGVKGINDQWAAALKVQQQMTTGRRIVTPSDDPVAAAQVLNVQQSKDINTQFATNIKYATTALTYEEGHLGSIVDMFGNIKELAVSATSSSLTSSQRTAIATELRARFDGLMAIANAKDENGQYLFSGFKGDIQPFTGSVDSTVSYAGDAGERQIQISPSRVIKTGDSGANVFENIFNGNGVFSTTYTAGNTGTGVISGGSVSDPSAWVAPASGQYTLRFTGGGATYELYDGATLLSSGTYTAGQAIPLQDTTVVPAVSFGASVTVTGTPANGDSFAITPSTTQSLFTALSNLIHAVESTVSTSADQARYAMDIQSASSDIQAAFTHIVDVRSALGGRINEVQTVSEINTDTNVQYASTLSDLQDLDVVAAASELSQRQVQLQAAQKSFNMTTGLSLFSYL